MHFLDPTNDYAFKKIFGDEKKKHILISFLNSILRLPADQQITEVTLLNPTQAPHLPGAKETILDVRCQDQRGAEYIVEMQVLPQEFFDKRVLYYASKAYAHQLNSGSDYCKLKPVIFLGILNFEFTHNDHYLSTHCVQDVETKEHVLQDFRFTFAELPKFLKTEAELLTVEDKWLYFLKHAKKLAAIPAVIHEAALKEAFEIVNRLNWDEASLELYDIRGIYTQDEIQRVNFGYRKGQQNGQHTLLLCLLQHRFGLLPTHYQERLDKANENQLLLWGERLLDAKTLDDIFEV
jgi:predicted transposase/invertase (TIGR01784 family)